MVEPNDILIADAGGTGTHWCLLSRDGRRYDLDAAAINASVMEADEIRAALEPVIEMLSQVSELHFYGAGCVDSRCGFIEQILREAGCKGSISVNSDILGAARGLFGDADGLVCILGTGSNVSLYKEGKIFSKVPSLGYILGDEGSGASIGKRFLHAYMRHELNEEICSRICYEADLSVNTIYERVYRAPGANKFLASLTKYLHKYLSDKTVRRLVEDEFESFVQNLVLKYDESRRLPIGITGSVAYYFGGVLIEVMNRNGLNISKIERTPMTGLADYHKQLL